MPEEKGYTEVTLELQSASGRRIGVDTYICNRCGALVGVMAIHDEWHKRGRWEPE